MNTEEVREKAEETTHFDAHEFDGLREALEREAEGLYARVNEFVRENPLLCAGIAAAAGFAVATLLCRKSRDRSSDNQPVDSRRM